MINWFQLSRTFDIKVTSHQSIGWGWTSRPFWGYIEYLRESVVFGSNTSYIVPPSWTLRYTCTSTNHPYSSKFLSSRVSCNFWFDIRCSILFPIQIPIKHIPRVLFTAALLLWEGLLFSHLSHISSEFDPSAFDDTSWYYLGGEDRSLRTLTSIY